MRPFKKRKRGLIGKHIGLRLLVCCTMLVACCNVAFSQDILVERILDFQDLRMLKGQAATSFILDVAVGDSIKVECPACAQQMNLAAKSGGGLALQLESDGRKRKMGVADLGHWLPAGSKGGKLALIFLRDALGEKVITLHQFKLSRKTKVLASKTNPKMLLKVSNLYIGEQNGKANPPTTCFVKMKTGESLAVNVADMSGSESTHVAVQVYREVFDKQPLDPGAKFVAPTTKAGGEQFGVEFLPSGTAQSGPAFSRVEIWLSKAGLDK